MKWIIASLLYSTVSFSCAFTMVEQEGRFLLVQERLGEAPSPSDETLKPLNRRGLQEVKVKDKEGLVRSARVRVIYDSDNKAEIQRVIDGRCK
jgi:hypothetical protein